MPPPPTLSRREGGVNRKRTLMLPVAGAGGEFSAFGDFVDETGKMPAHLGFEVADEFVLGVETPVDIGAIVARALVAGVAGVVGRVGRYRTKSAREPGLREARSSVCLQVPEESSLNRSPFIRRAGA